MLKHKLPKRIEMTPLPGMGTKPVVYRDFEWNVPLDDNLFVMPVGKESCTQFLACQNKGRGADWSVSIRQAFLFP